MNLITRNALILLAASCSLFASTYGGSVDTTKTTLAVAMTVNQTYVCVASATGINTNAISNSGSLLVVDKEEMAVTTAGISSTCFNVKRGQDGTAPSAHINARNVWVTNVATGTGDSSRPFAGGAITKTIPSGACTASAQYSLPVIFIGRQNDVMTGDTYFCYAGVWTGGQSQGTNGQSNYTVFTTYPTPGNVVAPTPITDVSGKLFFSQIFVGTNTATTGGCILNGSGAGTDAYVFALWDAKGTLLANTALAGTTSSGASLMQCIAWVTPTILTGPASYFIGVQGNGTTAAQFSAYKTGGAPTGYLTGSQTGGTFGTILNIATIPTTFTTAVGPYMSLY